MTPKLGLCQFQFDALFGENFDTQNDLRMKAKINRAAKILRQFLEGLRSESYSEGNGAFYDFPKGCCEYASAYLGKYLIREGICAESEIEVPAKNNMNSDGKGHSWLYVRRELNVDITADQFGYQYPTVIVARNSKFHSGFKPLKWEPFPIHESYVFATLGKSLQYIPAVWENLNKTLPKLR